MPDYGSFFFFFFLNSPQWGSWKECICQFFIADDRLAFIDLNMRDFIKQNTQTDGKGGKHILHSHKGGRYLK